MKAATVLEPKWLCESCDEIHDDEEDARDCCPTQISEVFLCPICQMSFYVEIDALNCHDFDPNGPPPPPTPAELEAAGQMRLLP